ncbi:MAG: OmpA family protein [Desulfobacteraceae bacterium]|nr:OmpA family protein [Desulfobacteraceae bacterium]
MYSNRIKFGVLSICAIFIFTACSTVNPYTEEKQASKLAIGAGVGAASGALVGLLTSNNKNRQRNALLGAGFGALAGGSVGYYMDVQETKLRQRLRNSGVSVTRTGDNIVLNMPGNVTFETNSSDISSGFYKVLNSVAIVLNEYKKTTVDVIGHTDSTGSENYNMTLSQRRAGSVAQYLASQKVISQRLLIAGRGENQPIASNKTPEGRSRNRRVELQIVPLVRQ